jgi:glucose-1-phosphate adenylyltransferase
MQDQTDPARTVAFLLAGGEGRRLHELTARQCKPALHFLHEHRLADFAVASALRSGLTRMIVATQHCPATLARHLHTVWGPAWSPGRVTCAWGPEVRGGLGYSGTADALRANADALDAAEARDVVVMSAAEVHAIDLRPLMAAHREGGARATVATDGQGRAAWPGLLVLDWAWARERLADPGIVDLEQLLPDPVATWHHDGYWRHVDTLDSFRRAWLDFEVRPLPCPRPLAPGVSLSLPPSAPDGFAGRISTGDVRLYSPLAGGKDRSRWAVVDRSVLMPGSRIAPGVRLTRVIVAPGTAIPEGMRIGFDPEEDERWFRVDGDTTLVTPAMIERRTASGNPLVSMSRRARPASTGP